MTTPEIYYHKKPTSLGFDQLGIEGLNTGFTGKATLLGIVDGREIAVGPNIPGKIRGQALIVQTAEGKITAIPAPRVNLETIEIGVFDFNLLNPALQQEVLNALFRSRKMKRQRIGQYATSAPNR